MAQIRLNYLFKEEAPLYAGFYLPLLSRIEDIDQGRWTLDGCFEEIKNGNLTVWIIQKGDEIIAAFTTRICESKIKYLVLEDVGGDGISDWIDLCAEKTEAFARAIGCTQICIGGRPGWEKYFKRFGFIKSRVEGVKHLEAL